MSTWQIIGIILMSACITVLLRALPFLIFNGNKTLPKPVQTLGRYLPPAIMAVLIVYCLKDARGDFLGTGVWQLLAVVVVAVSYKWKHNTFLSIMLGTVCYMVLLRIF